MKRSVFTAAGMSAMVLFVAGCKHNGNSSADYEAAINNYYKATPVCLWPESKKMPVQAATSDDAKTEGYDALTDAGLLTRTTAEKKVFIVASKQVNNYDLSGQGRSNWTADASQPGYGNFCFGHRAVTSIDSAAPGTTSSGAQSEQVNYHYKVDDVPAWANSQEMKTAFPSLDNALTSPQGAQATLVKTGDQWQVTK